MAVDTNVKEAATRAQQNMAQGYNTTFRPNKLPQNMNLGLLRRFTVGSSSLSSRTKSSAACVSCSSSYFCLLWQGAA